MKRILVLVDLDVLSVRLGQVEPHDGRVHLLRGVLIEPGGFVEMALVVAEIREVVEEDRVFGLGVDQGCETCLRGGVIARPPRTARDRVHREGVTLAAPAQALRLDGVEEAALGGPCSFR